MKSQNRMCDQRACLKASAARIFQTAVAFEASWGWGLQCWCGGFQSWDCRLQSAASRPPHWHACWTWGCCKEKWRGTSLSKDLGGMIVTCLEFVVPCAFSPVLQWHFAFRNNLKSVACSLGWRCKRLSQGCSPDGGGYHSIAKHGAHGASWMLLRQPLQGSNASAA